MLSDALVSIAAVSVCCTITAAALGVIAASDSRIRDAYEESEQQYEETLSEIGECICEEEPEPGTETDGDILSSSF